LWALEVEHCSSYALQLERMMSDHVLNVQAWCQRRRITVVAFS